MYVGHDDGAAAERDVGGAGDGGAARDFVAGVLWEDGLVDWHSFINRGF